MDDKTRQGIQHEVRERYSSIARSPQGSCCGPSPCCGSDASSALPGAIPLAAVASARGCGNPLDLANLQEGETVLDLGSGGGLDVLLAAQKVGEQGIVYGLDANPDMLDLARRNAAQAGTHHVRFLHGDLEDIPLPDQTVDVIISNCVINLTLDKQRALTEAFRVLRPGGRLAVSDIVIDPDLEGLAMPGDEVRRRLDWASCSAGALTRHQLHQALHAAGFEAIDLQVLYRQSIDELSLAPGETWEPLTLDQARQVGERFASMTIAARRPA